MTVKRREFLMLATLLGTGGAVSWGLRAFRLPGDDIGNTPVVRAMFAEPAPVTGNPDGDLQLAIFSDYNCPACRRGHPALLAALAADGQVAARHLEWPVFGDDSRDAARIALVAAQMGLFAPVSNQLMTGPRATGERALAAIADSGGDLQQARTMLDQSIAAIDGQLSRYAFHAFSLGLRGTPSYVCGQTRADGIITEAQWARLFRKARRQIATAG